MSARPRRLSQNIQNTSGAAPPRNRRPVHQQRPSKMSALMSSQGPMHYCGEWNDGQNAGTLDKWFFGKQAVQRGMHYDTHDAQPLSGVEARSMYRRFSEVPFSIPSIWEKNNRARVTNKENFRLAAAEEDLHGKGVEITAATAHAAVEGALTILPALSHSSPLSLHGASDSCCIVYLTSGCVEMLCFDRNM